MSCTSSRTSCVNCFGPGGPGRLLTRGSHRSVRARFSAYGSSNHGFTVRNVIRGGCVDTKPRFDVLAVCPRHGSMIRRRASLHRVRSGAVPLLPRYYHGATTSCRPSRRPSLPSRGGTTRCVWSSFLAVPDAPLRGRGSLGSAYPVTDAARGHDRISQVPGEPPLPLCPCSSTPVGLHAPHPHGTAARPPPLTRTTAPTLKLSKLYHTALRLAVYASCSGSPHSHARLASRCW